MPRISGLTLEEVMSDSYHIGLSREQVEKLLAGEEVGKRTYSQHCGHRYGDVRVYVKMLTEEEQKKEPEGAFTW